MLRHVATAAVNTVFFEPYWKMQLADERIIIAGRPSCSIYMTVRMTGGVIYQNLNFLFSKIIERS